MRTILLKVGPSKGSSLLLVDDLLVNRIKRAMMGSADSPG